MSKKTFTRECPECNKTIIYKHHSSVWLGNKRNSRCKSCAVSGKNNPMYGKTGKANPFYGKKHSEASKAKQRMKMKGRKLSPAHRAKLINVGKKNIIQGNVYVYWVNKYGQDEADRRLRIAKAKHSKNNSGERNPMYGRPSPNGSGNGWSGWYNGWFFRSLRELKYVLELDEQGIPWLSAESAQYKVCYTDHLGQKRNYFPDFLVDNKTIVECKPKKLWKSPKVQAKTKAAKKYFSKLGLEFKIVDPGTLDENKFKLLWKNGIIRLIERYQKKALGKYNG